MGRAEAMLYGGGGSDLPRDLSRGNDEKGEVGDAGVNKGFRQAGYGYLSLYGQPRIAKLHCNITSHHSRAVKPVSFNQPSSSRDGRLCAW